MVLLCKDHGNPTLLANYRSIALCNSFYQLVNIIFTSRIRGLTEKYAVLASSQHGFRGSRSVQFVIQKERWLSKQAMKQDIKLIRVDLDFKNAFNSAHQEITLVYICRIRMRLYVIKSLNDIYMSNNF